MTNHHRFQCVRLLRIIIGALLITAFLSTPYTASAQCGDLFAKQYAQAQLTPWNMGYVCSTFASAIRCISPVPGAYTYWASSTGPDQTNPLRTPYFYWASTSQAESGVGRINIGPFSCKCSTSNETPKCSGL